MVAVFGLSPFVVVLLALLASPFFCCQDGGDKTDEVAGSGGKKQLPLQDGHTRKWLKLGRILSNIANTSTLLCW